LAWKFSPARAVHHLWFRRVVPLVGGMLSDRKAYAYLPASTAYLPPRPQLQVQQSKANGAAAI